VDVLDGRYRLIRRLAGGGMASVWLAHDERLDRDVAIKLIADVLAEDEDYRRRFEREAQVAAGLHHPNLIAVFDYSAAAERPYLVMELVRGATLAERIESGTGSELDHMELARELLSALDSIHRAGIVHRDVKPANVLIDPGGRARLTDFGIARPSDATSLTQTGKVIGTLGYMAPEVKRGGTATPRSDLYSLGLVLRESGGGTDPDLAALVAELTAEDTARRPSSADAALAMLETSAAAGPAASGETEPLGTAPTAPMPAKARVAGRTWAWVGAGTALAALTALILAIVAGGGEGEDGSPAPGSHTSRQAAGSAVPTAKTTTTTTTVEAAPTTTAEATAPSAATPTATESCDGLDEEKKALDEDRKAAEEAVKDDPEAKKAVHDRYEMQKQTLEEEIKACKEAEH
jgi:serine/threonine-protein kinase